MRVLCIIIHSSVTTNQTIISSLPLHCIGLGWPRDLQWLGSAFSCLWPQTAANDDHDVQYTHRSIWHKQKTSRQMASAAANQTTSHISALQSRYINYNLHFERNETQRSKREKEKAKKKTKTIITTCQLNYDMWLCLLLKPPRTLSLSLCISSRSARWHWTVYNDARRTLQHCAADFWFQIENIYSCLICLAADLASGPPEKQK